MTAGGARHGGGAERLAATFAADQSQLFLRENGDSWSVGRLLAYAGDVAQAIPGSAGPVVAVRSHTAAFVVASLLGVWKSGRAPLLIDPALAAEPEGLRSRVANMPVIAPAEAGDPWSDVGVAERGREPISPVFPAATATEVLFFTSGSTGEPKIVARRAAQFTEQHLVEAPWLRLAPPLPVLCFVPAFHILGYIYGFDMPASVGGHTSFARGGAPHQWLELIRSRHPALVVGVPSHYRLMARIITSPLPKALYLCSGGPLDPTVAAHFQQRAGWPVLQVYGSTETGGIATRLGLGAWQPFPTLAWRTREADGRLEIKSAWQERPAEWYCTDDAVAPEGETFRLLGRADSVVKIGGRRFSTGEVVSTAVRAPNVEQAHAVVYERFGELAVALFVVPSNGHGPTAQEIRSFLATRLAAFKLPRTIEIVPELPTRGIGKVDEEALRNRVQLRIEN